METNPYETPGSIESSRSPVRHPVFDATRNALFVYLVSIVGALLLGTFVAGFRCLVQGLGFFSFTWHANWWYENAHFLLVAPPLLFSLTAFIHYATEQRCRAEIAGALLMVAGMVFFAILNATRWGSPRYLRGLDPLFYPVEIWGYVVSYGVVTVAIVCWTKFIDRV